MSDSDESEYRHEVSSLVSWCDNNNLQLNASKTREMIVDFRKRKNPLAPIIVNGDSIERVDCFKCLGTIIIIKWLSLGKQQRCCRQKGPTKTVLPAPTKEVRADERNSCSVLSFCYWEYSYILNMCMIRRHQPAPEEQTFDRVVKTASKIVGSELTYLKDISLYKNRSKKSWQNYLRPNSPRQYVRIITVRQTL